MDTVEPIYEYYYLINYPTKSLKYKNSEIITCQFFHRCFTPLTSRLCIE